MVGAENMREEMVVSAEKVRKEMVVVGAERVREEMVVVGAERMREEMILLLTTQNEARVWCSATSKL